MRRAAAGSHIGRALEESIKVERSKKVLLGRELRGVAARSYRSTALKALIEAQY